MNNELTIKISGKSGVGKSTLAVNITKILKENGFSVTLSDPDVEDNVLWQKDNEELVTKIKNNTKINITTVLENR